MNARLEKLGAFFREESGYAKLQKPAEILELPFSALKVVDPAWDEFLEEEGLKTIKDVAEYKDKLEFEGVDPEEINKAAMIAEMIYTQVKQDRKSTRLNSSHSAKSRMPSSA